MPYDLEIIIVNWNVRDLLAACLRSIADAGSSALSGEGLCVGRYAVGVTVVDNASQDDSVAMLRSAFPWVKVIASAENLGFGRGNNLALQASQARYVLVLNPDTELVGAALQTMLAFMDKHLDVGVLGPRLLYGDGSLQSSRRRFPTLGTALWESTLLGQWFPNNRWRRRYHMVDQPADQQQEVDWLVGACLMVRREVVQQVGLFDPGFFMYSEEMDWCRRITAAGWQAVYLPSATVVHHEAQSSGQVSTMREIYFGSSKAYYFRKHHGRLVGEAVRLMLLADILAKVIIEGNKFILGHKRPLRRERLRTYAQVLRSGLRATPPSGHVT